MNCMWFADDLVLAGEMLNLEHVNPVMPALVQFFRMFSDTTVQQILQELILFVRNQGWDERVIAPIDLPIRIRLVRLMVVIYEYTGLTAGEIYQLPEA